MMKKLYEQSSLDDDQTKIKYINIITTYVKNGKEYDLAKTILRDWHLSQSLIVQMDLLALLTTLAEKGCAIDKAPSILLQGLDQRDIADFTKSDIDCIISTCKATGLNIPKTFLIKKKVTFREVTEQRIAKEDPVKKRYAIAIQALTIQKQEDEDSVKFIVEQYHDELCEFFIESMQGDDQVRKHTALQVAPLLVERNWCPASMERILEQNLQDVNSEFYTGSFYLLSTLVERNQLQGLAQRVVTTLSEVIKNQNSLLQTNYLSVLEDIWNTDLKVIAQNAVTLFSSSQEHTILSNTASLLSLLIKKSETPDNIDEIIKNLKQAPFEDIRQFSNELALPRPSR